MTRRTHTPLHDKWHRIVEGQIRHCMSSHPEYFNFNFDCGSTKQTIINSLAKRIVGEIVADVTLAAINLRDERYCSEGE